MYISGEQIWKWLVSFWPMDWKASVFFAVFLIGVYVYFKHKDAVALRVTLFLVALASFIKSALFLPWSVFKGLFFTKDAEGEAQFNAFKALFILMSFVVVFRVALGGKTLEGVKAGPQINFLERVASKASKRTKATSKPVEKNRPWLIISVWKNDPIALYELLAWLISCMLFYYRHDLTEGEKGQGFENLLATIGQIYTLRAGGKVESSNIVLPSPEISVTTQTKHTTTRTSSIPVWSEKDDPFLR